MKRFLALCCVAAPLFGQALVGLPQYGVMLSGSPENPVIVNHSGKAVIAYDVETMDANGRRSGVGGVMAPSALPAGIPDGGSAYAMGAAPVNPTVPMAAGPRNASLGPIVRAALLSVIFANGQFVGADERGSFEGFAKELKAITEVGKLAKIQAWGQVEALAEAFRQMPRQPPPNGEDHVVYTFRQLAASRLVEVRKFDSRGHLPGGLVKYEDRHQGAFRVAHGKRRYRTELVIDSARNGCIR